MVDKALFIAIVRYLCNLVIMWDDHYRPYLGEGIRNKVDWMLESFHFPRGLSMYGINYHHSVYMLVHL